MKVKDLIEQLQKLDPELEVWQARDPEGNGYFQTGGAWEYWAEDDGGWELTIFNDKEEASHYYGEDTDHLRRVVIIWP